MNRSLLIPVACLLLLTASCGTKAPTASLPTPGLDQVKQIAKCPQVPDEYEREVKPPVFADADNWADWSHKLWDWGMTEWKQGRQRAKWKHDHPGC